MTAFDTPDWVAGQTTVARDKVLYDSGATPQTFPLDSGALDVSRWQAITVAILTDDTATWGIGRVLATHTAQGDTVGLDYAMFQFGNNGSQIDTGALFSIPVPGDAVQVQIDHYTAAGKARMIVIGTTRPIARTAHPSKTLWVPPTVLAGNPNVSVGSNIIPGIIGPYANGISVSAFLQPNMGVIVNAYVWDGSTISAYPIASLFSASGAFLNTQVYAPGMVLYPELANDNSSGSVNLQYVITSY